VTGYYQLGPLSSASYHVVLEKSLLLYRSLFLNHSNYMNDLLKYKYLHKVLRVHFKRNVKIRLEYSFQARVS